MHPKLWENIGKQKKFKGSKKYFFTVVLSKYLFRFYVIFFSINIIIINYDSNNQDS